jgi:cysteate synthase
MYRLKCPECGEIADGFALRCSNGHDGLLRTEYSQKTLRVNNSKSIFKFSDWLPTESVLESFSAPTTFISKGLRKELGLENLWIAFTGYYPEKNAYVTSCSFKELEALPTFARINDRGSGTVVVASAGNTGRAFAQVSGETGLPCVVVVPETAKDRIQVSVDGGAVKLITVAGDYADSISVAERISSIDGFVPEGGARNVARRDGMGTVILESALKTGWIPDHYFQAVGSGTGGIAAWEASLRLIEDGRFGNRLPRLHLSQNLPFIPMTLAWADGRREISLKDLGNAEKTIPQVFADVLTNRNPPYSMPGGLFDALTACGGSMYGVTNKEAQEAEKLWKSYENTALDPAAAVALASLVLAVENGNVKPNDRILLNITGGGRDRVKDDIDLETIKPLCSVRKKIDKDELMEILNE